MRKCFSQILWGVLIMGFPLLTTWGLLFTPGFYSYSDQHFPLSTTIPPTLIVSNQIVGNLQFDRLLITFPYYFFSLFTNNIQLLSRFFLFYTFFLYSVLCYLFSNIVVQFYSNTISELSFFKKQLSKLPIFIISYSNLSALNLNADGGTWADSIILILISISIILILQHKEGILVFLLISGFLIITFLLNPDYAPMFLICVLILPISSMIAKKTSLYSLLYSIIPVLFSFIPLVFLYLQSFFIGNNYSSGFNNIGYRNYSLNNLKFFSTNINMYDVIFLLGHYWSTITFAPPSILFSSSDIPFFPSLYSPAQVLLPTGFVTILWIISLISFPLISFFSFVFKRTRKYALSIAPLLLIVYLITQEYNIKIIFYSLQYVTFIPIIGKAIGTSLSLPGHFINFLAFIYLPLFSLSIITIIDVVENFSVKITRTVKNVSLSFNLSKKSINTLSDAKSIKPILFTIIVVFMVTLSGWQAFNGSLYPMRAYDGSYLIGNSVEPKGALSPTIVNTSVINAYNLVTSSYSSKNYSSEFNTLWIGGPTCNDFPYEGPPLSISLNSFRYITENGLLADVAPYLIMHSVRYVVISNENINKNLQNPFSLYGFNNYSSAFNFFNSSGLKKIFNQQKTTVFKTSNLVNLIANSNLILNSSKNYLERSSLYMPFSKIGYNISFSNNGVSTGFANNTDNIDVITPSYLPFSKIFNTTKENEFNVNNEFLVINSQNYVGQEKYSQNNSLSEYNHQLPGNFTTTSWYGNTSIFYDNGNFSLYSDNNNTFSIDYNGSMAIGPGGVNLSNFNRVVAAKLSFIVNGTKNFHANSQAILIAEGSNTSRISDYYQRSFNVSQKQKYVNYTSNFPVGTKHLGFRIMFSGFSGTVNISNISFYVYSTSVDSYSPFGSYVNLSNLSFNIPQGYSSGYVFLKNKSQNILPVLLKAHNYHVNINGSFVGAILLKNNINKYIKNYMVVNKEIPNSYNVYVGNNKTQNFYLGLDGSYIYEVNGNHKIHIVYRIFMANLLTFYYFTIMSLTFVLIAVPLNRIVRFNLKKHFHIK